ncbi:YwaF family protein [Streptococcus australis]|uniref:Major facilitator superfamily permease n=1 Tax=Streptococcus australis TaxID=113107 RepID=A0A4V0BU89_9STRE|nr:TIGR02206 family membrane protein [Streptococcus australis]VTS72275.1 major facilitator superfamily permease [Streptococcus australis]
MNLWEQLFTTQISEPPQFELHWYIGLLCLLALTFYASYRFRDKVAYQRFIQILQSLQLIVLYSWYWGNQMPLSESLPFYHCRIAMFVMLLIPGTSKYKQYFALLGTFGATAALAYPLFDPYPFPHVTILSFIIGHVALLGNALLYLFKNYEASLLNLKNVTVITFSLNALIGIVNLVVGGDYGFLNKPPLVGNHGLLANYLIVSSVLVAAISLTAKVVEVFLQQRAEKMIQEKA